MNRPSDSHGHFQREWRKIAAGRRNSEQHPEPQPPTGRAFADKTRSSLSRMSKINKMDDMLHAVSYWNLTIRLRPVRLKSDQASLSYCSGEILRLDEAAAGQTYRNGTHGQDCKKTILPRPVR
jgi:hypothetical protein